MIGCWLFVWKIWLLDSFFPLSQKRPMPFDSLESLAVKRQRLTEQRLQQQPSVNGLLNNQGGHDGADPTLNPSFHTKTEFQRTSNQNDSAGGHSGFPLMHKLSSTPDTPVPESRDKEPTVSSHQPPQGDSDCTHQQLTNSQHKKKKSKKHKDKERERLKDNQGSNWLETSPDLKQHPDKLDSKATFTRDFLLVRSAKHRDVGSWLFFTQSHIAAVTFPRHLPVRVCCFSSAYTTGQPHTLRADDQGCVRSL